MTLLREISRTEEEEAEEAVQVKEEAEEAEEARDLAGLEVQYKNSSKGDHLSKEAEATGLWREVLSVNR